MKLPVYGKTDYINHFEIVIMQQWNDIVNTAMLGTEKKVPDFNAVPQNIVQPLQLIQQNQQLDKEEKYLQAAALIYNYQVCGAVPFKKENLIIAPAPAEEKPYCNKEALQVLNDILSEENIPLLAFWLQHCAAAGHIIHPELVHRLLQLGAEQKKLQTLITACCGNRGKWLAGFNEAWNFSMQQSTEETWQTGTPEQRRNILTATRKHNPVLAVDWLQQTWPQEDAATKTTFLEILQTNISAADIEFLELLATEKSKKVKELALDLLKNIPQSAVVQQYESLLAQTVQLKKEKALLGLSTKTVLLLQLPQVPDAVFNSGIEKLSSTKEFTDDEYIIYQLAMYVPPTFWQQQLNTTAEGVIKLLQDDAVGKKILPALVLAVKRFNNNEWAAALLQHSKIFYLDIMAMLPPQQQNDYSIRFFEGHEDTIIQNALNFTSEWSTTLTQKIFTYTAKNAYQYNRSFYSQHIHLIPMQAIAVLEKCMPSEAYQQSVWAGTSEYITKLISLKTQTITAFQP
jgi:hypothetical protein